MPAECPFCSPDPSQLIFEADSLFGIWDRFPVSPGHALVIPRRHIPAWFDATQEEQIALLEGIAIVRQNILRRYDPTGFNIGINVHATAGQTVFHLHVHIIPRYAGDVSDPRGGVRNVIPHMRNYPQEASLSQLGMAPHNNALISGANDPLLPHLLSHLDRAISADICVAFVQPSGLRLIQEHLRDLLHRGGKVRFLTGDYLDITDPQALLGLLDLDGELELRVFESRNVSFHPKSYLFHFADGTSIALVGSSNLSASALRSGIEWNYRVVTSIDPQGITAVQQAFSALFFHPATQSVTDAWVKAYVLRRRIASRPEVDVVIDSPEPSPEPHLIQREALSALENTRREGNSAGLVVLATGLGKTWLSVFDSSRDGFERILFVAHREEILGQALKTFRQVRPNATLGRYTGTDRMPDADVLFASIQTLGKQSHLRQFDRARFDYIVVDEFHHAAAATYRNLIGHFTPKFMLGLTATPERTDGGDLLALCEENLVYRCDVTRGIREGLLTPFHYFGVPDEVDYANIPWRNSRFDEKQLTEAVATQKRAQNILEQYRARAGLRTLAFCCSQRHCDFMAQFFCENSLRAVAVHAGSNSAPRAASLEALAAGSLDVIFSVDMFNEGVDLPDVDTVMMLRPTESAILWMQQFGRGLRRAENKTHLTVVDYIGNHRVFLNKPRTLLDLAPGDASIDSALTELLAGKFSLPPGCEVTYDLRAIDILRSLLKLSSGNAALTAYYQDFRERHGQRPTATELFHEGYLPQSVRATHGSWLRFVKSMGDLSEAHQDALTQADDFLGALETTPMTKSFKILTLIAMLNEDAFPGSISIQELADSFSRVAARSAVLRRDVGAALHQSQELIDLLVTNPIAAWTGGGTGRRAYFVYEKGVFRTSVAVAPELRQPLQELARELADWRLAAYLSRAGRSDELAGRFSCKVSRSEDLPVLLLPDRRTFPGVPSDWEIVEANAERYEAEFGKESINIIRQPGNLTNNLPAILLRWFGDDVGRPGTNHQVDFERLVEGYRMQPARMQSAASSTPELWRSYKREDIPPLFGLRFSTAIWNVGFVSVDKQAILLVTLDKGDLIDEHHYEDKFLSLDRFQWQSQNRTTQDSKHGQMLRFHEEKNVHVHLFVRRSKKIGGKPSPFYYCGPVTFDKWEGNSPITIQWRLSAPVPERLHNLFGLSSH